MESPSPVSDGSSWSKLPLDLLNMVFERLGFVDFHRATSVCQAWLHASRQSTPNNQTPWLIMFPEKGEDYYLLFNPEEKEKVYRIQDLGVEFANSHCLAIYGSWLLMSDPRCELYIMNLFTRERIMLPSLESQIGKINIERSIDDIFCIKVDDIDFIKKYIDIKHPILWIDEKTKDYVVMWLLEIRYQYLVYCRNGDNIWKHANNNYGRDMVYKDHKIYIYNMMRNVKVLEFSEDIPRQIFETQVNFECINMGTGGQIFPELGDVWKHRKTHLVISMTGEFLRVKSIIWSNSDVWSFRIYKLDSSNTEWEKLTSLGDEAILLDQEDHVVRYGGGEEADVILREAGFGNVSFVPFTRLGRIGHEISLIVMDEVKDCLELSWKRSSRSMLCIQSNVYNKDFALSTD